MNIPIVPGVMPVTSVKGLKRMAEISCAHIPPRVAKVFEGLDADPDTRSLVAATVASEMCQELVGQGFSELHFYTLNRAELVGRGLPHVGRHRLRRRGRMKRADRIASLKAAARERILILDGAAGSMFQQRKLGEADFRGARFKDHPSPLQGDNDLLCVSRPDVVGELHDAYLAAGADIVATNTFNATSISQADYALEAAVVDINACAARLARTAADRWTAKTPDRPRYVAGSIGPLRPHPVHLAGRERPCPSGRSPSTRSTMPIASRPSPFMRARWTSSWWRRCSTR